MASLPDDPLSSLSSQHQTTIRLAAERLRANHDIVNSNLRYQAGILMRFLLLSYTDIGILPHLIAISEQAWANYEDVDEVAFGTFLEAELEKYGPYIAMIHSTRERIAQAMTDLQVRTHIYDS